MALKRRHESHELATNDRLLQRNRESDTNVTIPPRRISTGDMRTLRNVDIAACEIQTGDMGTPLTGPLYVIRLLFSSVVRHIGYKRFYHLLCKPLPEFTGFLAMILNFMKMFSKALAFPRVSILLNYFERASQSDCLKHQDQSVIIYLLYMY